MAVQRETQKPVKKISESLLVRPKRVAVDLHPPSHVLGNMARNRVPVDASKNIAAADLALRINSNLNRYQGVDVLGHLTILVNNLMKKA